METQDRVNNLKNEKAKIVKELNKAKEKLNTKRNWDLISLIVIIIIAFLECVLNDIDLLSLKNLIPYITTYIIERTITAGVYGLNYVNKNKSKKLDQKLRDVNYLIRSFEESQEIENIVQYNEEITKTDEREETIPEIPIFDRHQKVKTIGSLKR